MNKNIQLLLIILGYSIFNGQFYAVSRTNRTSTKHSVGGQSLGARSSSNSSFANTMQQNMKEKMQHMGGGQEKSNMMSSGLANNSIKNSGTNNKRQLAYMKTQQAQNKNTQQETTDRMALAAEQMNESEEQVADANAYQSDQTTQAQNVLFNALAAKLEGTSTTSSNNSTMPQATQMLPIISQIAQAKGVATT